MTPDPGRKLPATRVTHRTVLGAAVDELTIDFSEPVHGADLTDLADALTHRGFRQRAAPELGTLTYEEWQTARLAFQEGYEQERGRPR